MRGKGVLLALIVLATTCAPGPQSGASPAATDQRTLAPPSSLPSQTPIPTLNAAPSTTPSPDPTPVPRRISGRATVGTTGAAVAGVQIRGMPAPLNDGRVPGPDVTAVTDDRGVYAFTVLTWTLEALVNSSSFQLMVQVTPPPALLVVGVTKSLGGPPGTEIGMSMGPLVLGDLDGPIDITLEPGHIIEGRVSTSLTGAPLEGISLVALRPNSMLIYGGAGDAFEVEARTFSDATGRYRLTVRSGTYVIEAFGPHGPERFWSDDPAIFQPTPIRVERDVAGIDLRLVPVTQIAGQVRSGPAFGDGVAGARVAAYLAGGTACCRVVGVATTGVAGTFLLYVPQGTYRVIFDPPAGSPTAAQWWRAAASFASAADVIVGTEQVRLEVELAPRRP